MIHQLLTSLPNPGVFVLPVNILLIPLAGILLIVIVMVAAWNKRRRPEDTKYDRDDVFMRLCIFACAVIIAVLVAFPVSMMLSYLSYTSSVSAWLASDYRIHVSAADVDADLSNRIALHTQYDGRSALVSLIRSSDGTLQVVDHSANILAPVR